MRTVRIFLLALAALVLQQLAPAHADTLTWRATVEGRVGYGTNPFLQVDQNAGSGLAGFTVAPVITLQNAKATTELSGSYNRDQYFSHYGAPDDLNIDLRRVQQLSTKLTANAQVGYFSSISGLLSPYYNSIVVNPGAVDQLAVGLRQRRFYGQAGVDWHPTQRDHYTLSGIAEHDSYSRFGSTFNYYGVTGGYTRQINARTQLGAQLTAGYYTSRTAGHSRSLSPNLVFQRVLSAHWTVNGSAGAIIERERIQGRTHNSVSPGFSVGACGTYTRVDGCVTASRVAASSGLGGLRRQTQIGANLTWKLTPHSRVLAVASYGISNSNDPAITNVPTFGTLHYALARLDYQRDLTRRVSAGVSGSFQNRTGARLPEAHALTLTFNLTAHLGRLA